MSRIAPILLLIVLAVLFLPAGSSAQSLADAAIERMGRVTFTLDGKTHTSAVKAYMVDNRLYMNGIWVEDSTVRFGRAGLASSFLLRVNGTAGDHMFSSSSGGESGAFLSVLYGGTASGRMYEILRADATGGSGSVTITRLTDSRAEGTFECTAYDKDNPSRTKNINGQFIVDFKKIGGE